MEATHIADCAQLVKVFEKAMLAAPSEGAVMGAMLPQVASIGVNAHAASSNLEDMVKPELPEPIQAILDATSGSVELPQDWMPDGKLFQAASDPLNLDKWRDWLEECIPCQFRVSLRAELFDGIDEILLATLEEMLNNFLKELAFILNILNAPDVYQDACLLLRALDGICIPDLQRMLSLLAALLYRLTAKEIAGIDIMKLIVLPIFQPIFLGIAMLFSQYKLLVVDPLRCVTTYLNLQLEKIKSGDFLNNANIARLEQLNADLRLLDSTTDKQEFKKKLKEIQQSIKTFDEGVSAIQNALGSSGLELQYWVTRGINEVESAVDELINEVAAFVGTSNRENIDFLLRQYEKLKILRLIAFVSGLIKALVSGFNCKLDSPDAAQHTLAQFFDNFLGPNSNVTVQVDPDTNDIQLIFNKDALRPLVPEFDGASIGIDLEVQTQSPTSQPPIIVQPTGDSEVDRAVNAIIEQVVNPVRVKPPCFFEATDEDNNKLAKFIAELDAIEV